MTPKKKESNWQDRKEDSEYRANFRLRWNADKIKLFRSITGMSQNEFASLIGIHQSVLSNYEKGRQVGDTATMSKMEDVLAEWKETRIRQLQSEIEFIKNL